MATMRYRLALDLGSTSLGWAMIRLAADDTPCAVIKAGVRIFSDGRDPKDGSSLAVTRREARAMRRRRDRLLKRKARMTRTLVQHGFFPSDEAARKALERLDPYALRAKGLDSALTGPDFARALFHINQRRGFKSNRKTDKKDNDSGALKQSIRQLRDALQAEQCRTVGEWLHRRHSAGQRVRARLQPTPVTQGNGKTGTDKRYDLYIDRAMIEAEFDALWAKQASLNPALYTEAARADLKDALLHQRPLKPVKPGRCTLLPEQERAPLALPSTQRFRIYQEINHLRLLHPDLQERALTRHERDLLADALEHNSKRTFVQITRLLGLGSGVKFNLEDAKRTELKGNTTSAILSGKNGFGSTWFTWSERQQDAIVRQLVHQQSLSRLVQRLQKYCGVDEARAEAIANTALPEGYGSLSAAALARILPELRREVVTYDKAVLAAGFEHHSHISPAASGEILPELPYYGEALERHVGFGSGKPEDSDEKRYGKIANPTVHIGLNQTRKVVNTLIARYGHPSEVIVELARDLKQSQEQRREDQKQQADNQKRNDRMRADIARILSTSPERVRAADIQKMILWQELNRDNALERLCPYSGARISEHMLLSDDVEIEHILPFSQTLDDSLNNKTVALRAANRAKGNRTPWQAFGAQPHAGFDYAAILERAAQMPKGKRYRFAPDGMERWLKDDQGFLARALNDTRYLSRVACEYLSLICPHGTRAIPGRMTAMLRAKFGLNDVLGLRGEKNRDDHRHHAVDACVIGVTDQGMLQRFAQASASSRERQLDRLVEHMPLPWGTEHGREYFKSVKRAIDAIWVSHKPDHSHEGAIHEETAYAPPHIDKLGMWRTQGIGGNKPNAKEADSKAMIGIRHTKDHSRHARTANGDLLPYKGYMGGSNYCIEIVRNEKGKWEGEVISTLQAYEIAKHPDGLARLRHPTLSQSGKPLVMRLVKDDFVRLEDEGQLLVCRVCRIRSDHRINFAPVHEANVAARAEDDGDSFAYVIKRPSGLHKAQARRVTISPIGELRDPGFKG